VKTLYKNIFEVLKIVKLDIYALDIRRNIHREHIKRLLKIVRGNCLPPTQTDDSSSWTATALQSHITIQTTNRNNVSLLF
jgi:hypothetical protein